MKANDPRHGTYAGYQAHRRSGEQACAPCKKGHSVYVAQLRKTQPDLRKKERSRANARLRALYALARLYPDDFNRLYIAELFKDREQAS